MMQTWLREDRAVETRVGEEASTLRPMKMWTDAGMSSEDRIMKTQTVTLRQH